MLLLSFGAIAFSEIGGGSSAFAQEPNTPTPGLTGGDFVVQSLDVDYYLTTDTGKVGGRAKLKVVEKYVVEFGVAGKSTAHGMERVILDQAKLDNGTQWTMNPQIVSTVPVVPTSQIVKGDDGITLRLGSASAIANGIQEYTITYTLDDVVITSGIQTSTIQGWKSEGDSFYLKVNGDAWKAPFKQINATVHLPQYLADQLDTTSAHPHDCWNGTTSRQDETECEHQIIPPSNATNNETLMTFDSTQEIPKLTSFTFAVGFKDGVFANPPAKRQGGFNLLQNWIFLLALIGIGLLAHPLLYPAITTIINKRKIGIYAAQFTPDIQIDGKEYTITPAMAASLYDIKDKLTPSILDLGLRDVFEFGGKDDAKYINVHEDKIKSTELEKYETSIIRGFLTVVSTDVDPRNFMEKAGDAVKSAKQKITGDNLGEDYTGEAGSLNSKPSIVGVKLSEFHKSKNAKASGSYFQNAKDEIFALADQLKYRKKITGKLSAIFFIIAVLAGAILYFFDSLTSFGNEGVMILGAIIAVFLFVIPEFLLYNIARWSWTLMWMFIVFAVLPIVGLIILTFIGEGVPSFFTPQYIIPFILICIGLAVGIYFIGRKSLQIALDGTKKEYVYTEQGLVVMRWLEGLREFMNFTEADRIKLMQSPQGARKFMQDGTVDEKTGKQVEKGDLAYLKLYNQLLPYAVVFGIEKKWNEAIRLKMAGDVTFGMYASIMAWDSFSRSIYNSTYYTRSHFMQSKLNAQAAQMLKTAATVAAAASSGSSSGHSRSGHSSSGSSGGIGGGGGGSW